MNTTGAQFPDSQEPGITSDQRDKGVVWSIFALCILTFGLAAWFLSGTWLGFALGFGSGAVALECVVVIRRIYARPSQSGGVIVA